MNPIVVLLTLAALILFGYVLFVVFRKWGTMSHTTHTSLPTIPLETERDAEIQYLVAQGQKIQAIKRVREMTGLGLKESKDYVDRLSAAAPLTDLAARNVPLTPDAVVEQEIRQLLAHRQKIEAIKRVRELTGMGLKESKDYVDSL